MNPAAVALKELLATLKEGEFFDEHAQEICYLVTKDSVVLAKAKAVALFDTDEEPVVESTGAEIDISDLFRVLD